MRLVLLDSASGELKLLFPDPSKGLTDDWLTAHHSRVLPSPNHRFAFDHQAGLERLLLLFSDSDDELDSLVGANANQLESTSISARVGSKGLLIEVDEGATGQAGLYAASRDGLPIILEVTLRHE